MKLKDFEGNFYILMKHHGVPGAAVETTDSDVKSAIRAVKKLMAKDRVSTAALKKSHAELAAELTKMLPEIARHGTAVSSKGEFYDQETFDNDLVLCAVYDHIANGKTIAITDNIGPGANDTVHEWRDGGFVNEGVKLDQDIIDLVKIYSDEGKTPAEIAKALNLKKQKVENILHRYYPERKNKRLPLAYVLNNNDRQEIVSKFKNGDDLRQLGRSYGVDGNTAQAIVKNILGQEEYNNEIKRRQSSSGKIMANKITSEMMDTIRKLYVQGKTQQYISDYLNNVIAAPTVIKAMKRQPDYEELRAKRDEITRKIKHGPVATTGFTRPGEIGVGGIKGPNSRHRSGVDWPKYGE